MFLQRRHTNDQQVYEKNLNITNEWGSANKTTLRYHITPARMTISKQTN